MKALLILLVLLTASSTAYADIMPGRFPRYNPPPRYILWQEPPAWDDHSPVPSAPLPGTPQPWEVPVPATPPAPAGALALVMLALGATALLVTRRNAKAA